MSFLTQHNTLSLFSKFQHATIQSDHKRVANREKDDELLHNIYQIVPAFLQFENDPDRSIPFHVNVQAGSFVHISGDNLFVDKQIGRASCRESGWIALTE